ncbi:TPA: hypothetical protein HA361_01325 [Candidatus Woesearchaeota archaeon]|nr:hypothetical protein [Candidatus Woesearchaeota archaeon]HII69341.1 hypothetical protein [Candidatus Woesearchaeota archaeon]
MKNAIWGIAAFFLGILAIGMAGCATQENAIVGNWRSQAPEDLGTGAYGTRDFKITGSTWSVVFTMYGDKDLAHPLFSFHAQGPYSIGSPSAEAQGASEAVFSFDKKTLTLLTSNADAISSLGFGDCGLALGEAKDISSAGCSFLPSVSACGQEYDLVKIEGNTLYLGARPADGNMCTEDRRPAALGFPLLNR